MTDSAFAMGPGDIVQLTDTKGRHHTLVLQPEATFHTHRGALSHDDLIGQPEGIVVTTTGGTAYVALRSLLEDFVLAMPRGAAVIYPKDAARIAMAAGLRPGGRVLEAGAGSGALTCTLLSAVGPHGSVVSCERRPDFADIARANVSRWFREDPPAWTLYVGDLAERLYVTKGNVSGLVDRLVEAGMVDRRAIPGDRRSYALHLTEEGRKAALAGMEAQQHFVDETVGQLPGADLEVLDAVISRWRETFRALEPKSESAEATARPAKGG